MAALAAAAGAAAVASDATKDDPILFVNFAFIERDLQDPQYLTAFQSALAAKRNEVMAEPPGPERTARLQTLSQFQTLVSDVRAGRPSNLFRLLTPADEAALIRRAFEMRLIPTVPGSALDVYIPARQQNTSWVGDIAMTIDIPRGNIFTAWLDQVQLTSLPRGQWSTIEFDVPPNVRDALLGDTGNARISIQPNIATCPTLAERQSGNVFSLDNLRFTGTAHRPSNLPHAR